MRGERDVQAHERQLVHACHFEASVVDDIEHSIEVEHLDSTGQNDIELNIDSDIQNFRFSTDDVGFMPDVLNF